MTDIRHPGVSAEGDSWAREDAPTAWKDMTEEEQRRTRPPHLNADQGPEQPWSVQDIIDYYGGILGCTNALFKADNYHQVVIETALVLNQKRMLDWEYRGGGGQSGLWASPTGHGTLRVWTNGNLY